MEIIEDKDNKNNEKANQAYELYDKVTGPVHFTEDSFEENKSIIIVVDGLTIDELNREKSKTIDKALANTRQI
jgi:archaellum component FlaG (FlaF/FlaG flagellin family)